MNELLCFLFVGVLVVSFLTNAVVANKEQRGHCWIFSQGPFAAYICYWGIVSHGPMNELLHVVPNKRICLVFISIFGHESNG